MLSFLKVRGPRVDTKSNDYTQACLVTNSTQVELFWSEVLEISVFLYPGMVVSQTAVSKLSQGEDQMGR